MSVQAITNEIISKYHDLHKIAYIKPKDNVTVPYWQLKMGKWRISQGLDICCLRKTPKKVLTNEPRHWRAVNSRQIKREKRRKFLIDAYISEKEVRIDTKPFWMRKTKALERISKALTEFIDNYNRDDVVEKGQVPIRVYTQEAIAHLKGENPNFKYVKYSD